MISLTWPQTYWQVCKDVNIEPQFLPVIGETFNHRTANTSNDARVNIKLWELWMRGQQALFNIRVFNPTIQYNEMTKLQYSERVLRIEHGSFTPLVFSIYGGTEESVVGFIID